MQHLFCTVMPEESVAEKQQKTEYKRCQNRSSGTDTEKQRSRKQKQDDKFCQMSHLQIIESGFKIIFYSITPVVYVMQLCFCSWHQESLYEGSGLFYISYLHDREENSKIQTERKRVPL